MIWFLVMTLVLLSGPVLVWTLTCTAEYKARSSLLCLADNPLFTSGSVSEADKKLIIDTHNSYRASVTPTSSNMMKAVWDDNLASFAQKWAQQCVYEHPKSGTDYIIEYNYTPGQNVAVGNGDWASALNGWEKEKAYFEYGKGKTVPDQMIGHYLQIVQGPVAKIGCGYANCNDNKWRKYYVCNYIAATYDTPSPYKQGVPCADCSGKCADGKLCDCGGKFCFNGGKLDLTTCKCACTGAVFGGDQCITKLSSKCSENPKCYTSPTGCEYRGDQHTPAQCATYGVSGDDFQGCKSKGGAWGCDECTKFEAVKFYCPKMCAICPS